MVKDRRKVISGDNFPVKRMKREICGERKSIKRKETHRISWERIFLLGVLYIIVGNTLK